MIQEFTAIARSKGATDIRGIATAVFRKARNGDEHLRSVNTSLGIAVDVVGQAEEGELGFLTALSSGVAPRANLVSWDSGAGSFQLAGLNGDHLEVFEGPLGDSSVTNALLRIQGKPTAGASPNPVSLDQALKLVGHIAEQIDVPPWIRRKGQGSDSVVVAIGERTSPFFVASLIVNSHDIRRHDLLQALEASLVDKSDAQLAERFTLFREENMAVPKICFVCAVLEACDFEHIHFAFTHGLCEGLLLE